MASCDQVTMFLQAVNAKDQAPTLAPNDLSLLQQANLIQILSKDQLEQMQRDVDQLSDDQYAITTESLQRQSLNAAVSEDTRKTHSILFKLEGVDKKQKVLEQLNKDLANARALDQDLAQRQQEFASLMAKKAVLDVVAPFGSNFVAITPSGRLALRDLQVRHYRVADDDFAAYWAQALKVDGELRSIAEQGASFDAALTGPLGGVDRSYVWAVAIGMAKAGGVPQQRVDTFVGAWSGVQKLSPNLENKLMAAEILAGLAQPLEKTLPQADELNGEVRKAGIAKESSLGVASILLAGQRADGTFATNQLKAFLQNTRSYESAALMAVVNKPPELLLQRFASVRSQCLSWGYGPSEDTELASSYFAVSDLPLETVGPKMAIISRGIAQYLQYPLVASAILASIPVLEANETLSLLEKAYEILGQRTGAMSQGELISLAVRTVHGIQVASVNELDPTAAAAPAAPGGGSSYGYGYRPMGFFYVPVIVCHGAYYSTYGAIGGAHPGHVHSVVGGGFGGGFAG